MASGRSFAVWWSETQAVFAWSQFRRTGSNYSTRPKTQKWNMMSWSVRVWMRLVTPGFTTMSSQHQSLNLKQKSLSKWQISDSLTWKMWQRTGPGPWYCCAGRRQSNGGKEKRKIRKKWQQMTGFFLVNSNFSSSTERCFSGNTTRYEWFSLQVIYSDGVKVILQREQFMSAVHLMASDVWLSPRCKKTMLECGVHLH